MGELQTRVGAERCVSACTFVLLVQLMEESNQSSLCMEQQGALEEHSRAHGCCSLIAAWGCESPVGGKGPGLCCHHGLTPLFMCSISSFFFLNFYAGVSLLSRAQELQTCT